MKYPVLIMVLIGALFIGGCAHEALYADREHGVASQDAFDQQIVNKDYKYAQKPVEKMDGIYAEHVMGEYLGTFTQGFTKEIVDIGQTGVSD